MVFKIDIEMACDHVNYNFLKFCLKKNEFPPIAIKLIIQCVTSSSMSIL